MNLISHRYLICVLFSVSTDRGRLFARLLSLLLLRVIIVVCWFCWCRRLLKVLLIPKDLGTTGDTFCVAWHVPGAIYRFAASLAPSLPSPSSVPPIYFLLSPFSLAPSRLVACSLFAICARYGCWSCLAVVAAVAVEIFTTYVGLFHYLQHSEMGPATHAQMLPGNRRGAGHIRFDIQPDFG